MKNLFNFKSIRTRILFLFSTVLFFVVIYSAFSLYSINLINKESKEIVNKQLALLMLDEDISYDMANRSALLRGYFLLEDESLRQQFENEVEASIALENELMELSDSESTKELLNKKYEWGTLTDKALQAYDRGDKEAALQIMQMEVMPLGTEITQGFEEATEHRKELINELGQNMVNDGELMMVLTIILSIASIVIGTTLAIFASNMIAKRIKLVMERMQTISDGDLSQEDLISNDRDEIGQLVHMTNKMSMSIRALLNQIKYVSTTLATQSTELTQSTNEVKTGAEQIAMTMEELANGTETQADSAGELSSAMSSFAVQVQEADESGAAIETHSKNVLDLTNTGRDLMKSSTTQMRKVDEIVHGAVGKVEGLHEHTQKITNLVSIIRDVAEQTNLLALNAAIEAARAGEHGKGFAVVADEVRKLAEQVALSVNDITDTVMSIQSESTLVTESLQEGYKEVQIGTEQIESTGDTFSQITEAVSSMVENISTITSNLSSIAANSQEMNGSIQEIAAISEESAAGVEETSASAEQVRGSMEEVADSSKKLATLAEELNDLVGNFKL
ncbi:methyl-accepting chemotaxis protein [Ornithinibacillus sp. BX22]|uniref:Methyl-accepting chemotaxis protein n=1 Tax=Ornithinibacillus hominis TaxID=2763055 RepID=A0A923L7N2_9BACI|nr:HAMP domain-containing methyl-accepting chemotaxis protein [Ornithinibacillus hominis]MBC5637934.1 methyl-accepting chemotaxis protein [Ornithinibacillus hominis]